MRNFRLFGKLGDMVYCLAAARGWAKTHHEQVRITLAPTRQKNFEVTLATLRQIEPLIAEQEYVDRVEIVEASQVKQDSKSFDWWFLWREKYALNLPLSACRFLDVADQFAAEPWLSVAPRREHPILFNFTNRWPSADSASFWRTAIERYPNAGFLGLDTDYSEFRNLAGTDIARTHADNLLEVARLIRGCDRLVCTQSSPLSIAHGLGTPVTVEASHTRPDCILIRRGAEYPGVSQKVIEERGVYCVAPGGAE